MLGVYDSGVGGLTVVKELRRALPDAGIIYVGDTARAPYGGKDPETLFSHGAEIIRFLLKRGATAIVVACGTSSSVSIDALRLEFPGLPMVDTIRPAVQMTLAQQTPDFRPVLIATEGTVRSGLFAKLFREEARNCELQVRACPLFAPIVEAGISANHPIANFAAEHYLADLRGKVNALVLGCTHYPLLTDAITRALGEIAFINPAVATAAEARRVFSAKGASGKAEYYATGDPENFAEIARFVLGEKVSARRAVL